MLIKHLIIVAIALLSLMWSTPGLGDEVIMKTGDKFQTSHAWQEGDKIRFDMQGLMVDVDRNDVATIIQSKGLNDTELSSGTPGDTPDAAVGAEAPFHHRESAITPRSDAPSEHLPPPSADAGWNDDPIWIPTNQDTGLQGIQWQMKPRDLPGLELVKIDPAFGGVDQYWCPDQQFQWGEVPLNGWVYGFWREQLYSIMIWVDGKSAYEDLRKKVVAQFGPGTKNVNNEERYIWINAASQRLLEYDAHLHMGIFVMRSSRVEAQIKEEYP